MGFTTGFTGGVTLTLGIAYLTVLAHERNRRAQGEALRSQAFALNSLLNPTPLPPPQSRAELAREERSTLVEAAKDRWNAEIENAVRWVQRTDWNDVRESMEGNAARLLGGGLQKSRDSLEQAETAVGTKIQEAVDRSRAAAQTMADKSATGLDRVAAKSTQGAERARAEVKDRASNIAVAVKEKITQTGVTADTERSGANTLAGLQDAADSIRLSGGTVDAARGAVRDAVSKGIEKGREVIGKAQAAIGLATDKIEPNAVEKALRERFQQSTDHERSVEEALAERYIPLHAKDNSRLRGL